MDYYNSTTTLWYVRKSCYHVFCFVMFCILAGSMQMYAQTKKSPDVFVQVSGSISLQAFFVEIEKQTEYRIVFSKEDVNEGKVIPGGTKEGNLNVVLKDVLEPFDLSFHFSDSYISISKKENNTGSSHTPSVAQPSQRGIQVKGVVLDKDMEPVIGASILEEGTTNGTVTDIDGNFTMNVGADSKLQISYIGYDPKIVAVNRQSILRIILEEGQFLLEDVVVVGYGTRKKSSLTTAVASVTGEELTSQSSSDLRRSLQGMVPGLTILDNGGNPGEFSMQMQIRGISSPNGSTPLVLVDGQVQDLNTLDPNSISSISVLKDAASTAIYGSRGANGIILVTTKKGEKGKVRINYEGMYGLQKATSLPEFMNTEQFFNWRNDLAYYEGQRNPGSNLPTYTQEEIQDYLIKMREDPVNHRAASYNMKDLYRPNRPQTRHSVTISGGSDFVRTLANASYYYQEGLVRNRTYERMSLRVNNDFTIIKSLKGHLNLYYQHDLQKKQASGYAEYEIVQGIHNPTAKWGLGGAPFYDEEGNYIPNAARRRNAMLETDIEYMGQHRITPDFATIDTGLEWEPISGLKFNVTYAYQKTWRKEEKHIPKWELEFQDYKTNSSWYRNRYISRSTFNALVNYDKTFNLHNINVMVGYSTEEYRDENQTMFGQDFFNNELRNIGSGSQENFALNYELGEWGLRSYFGRFAYNYDDRYYVEASFRSDGSSRFPKGNRYSQFPGVSIGWRLSNEKFWESLTPIIPTFKLRYSYGQTGSHDGIGNYSYIPQLNVGQNYDFSIGPNGEYAVNTVRQSMLASTSLGWEKVVQNDWGVDLAFLDNRLLVTYDYFTKVTNDVLLDLAIPKIVGLDPAKTNAGKVENKGWELDIHWRDRVGEVNYSVGFGMARVKDKLVDYAGLGIEQINDMYYRWEGSPLFAIRGYKVLGIIQTEEEAARAPKIDAYASQVGPGDYYYEDVNGDGKIDWDNDAQYLGSRTPTYTYNFKLSASWRGFDMNMFWNGTGGASTYLAGYLGEGGAYNNAPVSKFVLNNYWKQEGDTDVHFARPLFRESNNLMETGYSSAFVWSTNYFRLKSLVIGYTLPERIVQKIKLEKIRVFFEGTNLLTFSPFMKNWGLDPEGVPVRGAWDTLAGGNSNTKRHIQSPQLQTYNMGINIQF